MHISGIMIVMLIAKLLDVDLHSNFYTCRSSNEDSNLINSFIELKWLSVSNNATAHFLLMSSYISDCTLLAVSYSSTCLASFTSDCQTTKLLALLRMESSYTFVLGVHSRSIMILLLRYHPTSFSRLTSRVGSCSTTFLTSSSLRIASTASSNH